MDLVQRLHWFADTQDTAIFWGGCEGHFPIDDMRQAADEIERLRAALIDATNGLYNGFEPDNQSAVYKRGISALNHKV